MGNYISFTKKTNMDNTIISHFLPTGLLEYFTVQKVLDCIDEKTKTVSLSIYLDENNVLPSHVESSEYESKGFTSVTLQDFPIRGKVVYLVLRRRRWRNKFNKKEFIRNEFPFVADGSKLTKELSDFLKGSH
jgi:hypothetical protein